MTSTSSASGPAAPQGQTGAKGPDELRQQIEETRARLGDTVEELAAKADVKARAHEQMADLKGAASYAVHSAKGSCAQAVHTVRARVPRAALIGGVGATVAVVAGVLVWRRR